MTSCTTYRARTMIWKIIPVMLIIYLSAATLITGKNSRIFLMYYNQLMHVCMPCVVEFNITTTCIVIFQTKCTHVIASFACCMTDMISLMYSKISPLEKILLIYKAVRVCKLEGRCVNISRIFRYGSCDAWQMGCKLLKVVSS